MFTMITLYLILIFTLGSNLNIENMAVRKHIKIQMVLQSGNMHARYCEQNFCL